LNDRTVFYRIRKFLVDNKLERNDASVKLFNDKKKSEFQTKQKPAQVQQPVKTPPQKTQPVLTDADFKSVLAYKIYA